MTTQMPPWGMTLRPVIEWCVARAMTKRYRVEVHVVDAQGHVWAQENREPQDGLLPTNRWEKGRLIGDQYTLRLPPTMPTSEYQITVAVYNPADDSYLEARDEGDYCVAVQLHDVAGRIAFEHTARPANGMYLTTQWDAGKVLLDWHDFVLPGDLAAGTFQIGVVLRDAASGAEAGETWISSVSVVN